MGARHIPYAIGLFMLFPLVFWLVMSGLFIPGTGMVIDSAITFAMLAVSVPLVAWFYIANLSFLSNNIAGNCEYDPPRNQIAHLLISSLPWIAMAVGLVSIGVLRYLGEPWPMMFLPFALSAMIGIVILRGEFQRSGDNAHKRPEVTVASDPAPMPAWRANLGQIVLRAIYHVPVLGWMLRDAVHGRDSARSFFAINLILILALAIWLFGYPALIGIALVGAVFCFAMLVMLTWD
ncbi:MAG: hypothetical protein AAGD23_09025 [Pseudomonadota bacterium]